MGLFSKKKKEVALTLPRLPELEFPSYEPQLEPKSITVPKLEHNEAPTFYEDKNRSSLPELKKIIKEESNKEIHEEIPIRRRFIPERQPEREKMVHRRVEIEEKQPLFVRIENYKEALNDLENIKLRLREADLILDEMSRIRIDEEKELNNWKSELDKVKSKLLEIDRKLFESQ